MVCKGGTRCGHRMGPHKNVSTRNRFGDAGSVTLRLTIFAEGDRMRTTPSAVRSIGVGSRILFTVRENWD